MGHGPSELDVSEYPQAEGDPYYPVPRPENYAIYKQYQEPAANLTSVHFVGRLATYKYYNMDQVTAHALAQFEKLRKTQQLSRVVRKTISYLGATGETLTTANLAEVQAGERETA